MLAGMRKTNQGSFGSLLLTKEIIMQQLDMFSKELIDAIHAKVDRDINYHQRKRGANFVSQSRLYLFRLKRSIPLYKRYGLMSDKLAEQIEELLAK